MERRLVILKTRVRAYGMLDGVEDLKGAIRSFIPKFHELFLSHHSFIKKNEHSSPCSLSLITMSFSLWFLYFTMQIALSMNLSTLTSLKCPSPEHIVGAMSFPVYIFSCLLHSNHGAEHSSLLFLETFHNREVELSSDGNDLQQINCQSLYHCIIHPSFPNAPLLP